MICSAEKLSICLYFSILRILHFQLSRNDAYYQSDQNAPIGKEILFANLGCVGGDSVEDVDEEEEEDDKEAHPTSNLVHWDQE